MLVAEPIDLSFLDTQASHNAVSFGNSQITYMDCTDLTACMHVYDIATEFLCVQVVK